MRSDRKFEQNLKYQVIQGQKPDRDRDILNIGSLYLIQLYFKVQKNSILTT
jgi:hypothetical protein